MRLTEAESWARLVAARSAVLAVNDAGGHPLAVPVTFAPVPSLGERVIAFAVDHKPKSTTRLRRLDLIAADPRVSALADHYDDDWVQLWWVRVDGLASLAVPSERPPALTALAARYPQYRAVPPTGDVVLVRASAVRGWSAADLDERAGP